MRVAFRVDASLDIGTGHVMRCLTLANALRAQGADTFFVCRNFQGHLADTIVQRGHSVTMLPAKDKGLRQSHGALGHAQWLGARSQDDAAESVSALSVWGHPDWLVIDHYAIDFRWERALRNSARRILVIDDLADRKHDCDVLLDQNLQSRPDRYDGLLQTECRRLLGPGYALLRPEFAELRNGDIRRDGHIRRILVFLGGSDPENITGLVLNALRKSTVCASSRIVTVVGATNPHKVAIAHLCELLPKSEMFVQTPHMAQLMADADLMIGAGGGAMWERCCLGLPAIVICLAENQQENVAMTARKRIGFALKQPVGDEIAVLASLLDRLAVRPTLLLRLAKNAAALTDGLGCQKTIEEMVS